jgi:hypothetical protein
MMITARRVEQLPTRVRYAFGLGDEQDQILTINTITGDLIDTTAGMSVTGKIYLKIKHAWRETGDFPASSIFAS